MVDLRGAFVSLLTTRGLDQPDGRPLYAYRFPRDELERHRDTLRRVGRAALQDRNGAALVICQVAEWFRRERGGGHWDWIRPLKTLGLEYGPHAPVQYRDVENLVDLGLRVWRRPGPSGGERLLAIVREAGFPVASVREDPRISSWLKHSVLCAERGFATRDAVGAEAWRVSDRLAQALFDPAVDLCDKIVEIRRLLPPMEARSDPVQFLDQHRQGWREELPFDVECEDIRVMIEQIVRTRADGATALDVTRHLVRTAEGWQPRAELGLSGVVDLRRLPPSIGGAIREGRRLRVFPRPPYCDDMLAVAAIETFEHDGDPVHELRAFVGQFDSSLALEDEARLLVEAGSATIAEFVATGGEALDDPVIALDYEPVDGPETRSRLRVLGPSPVQTSRPMLALAVKPAFFYAVTFSAGYQDLGPIAGSDRRLVGFAGTARLELNGAKWTWRTSAERTVDARLVLVGNLLRGVREPVYRGIPSCWIERDEHLAAPRRADLYWRPKGRGAWQSIDGSRPWGVVDFAVIERGELRFTIGAAIVPTTFQISANRGRRELRVDGLDTRMFAAKGTTDLPIGYDHDGAIVALGPPAGTTTITLRLRWDAELTLTVPDPGHDLRLFNASDRLMPARSVLSLDGLKGIRILAASDTSLSMELRAGDAPRLNMTRTISGEVPLSAFVDSIRTLLGSSESLDARVAISAIGSADQIAEIRWYEEDVDPFNAPHANAFSALAKTYGLDMQAFSLAHPSAGTSPVSAPAAQAAMRAELSRSLPPGPWLIFGRRRNGAKLRPRIVPGAPRTTAKAETTLLERAIGTDASAARAIAFVEAYAQPAQVATSDRRTIIVLLTLARREGVPISSIDALKALDQSPTLATLLLAACDSVDERAALLDLQRDLPFIWSSTTVANWLDAFAARIEDTRRRLTDAGIDDAITYRSILSALSDIVALRPELAGHAKAVFLMLVTAEMTRAGIPVASADGHFLKLGVGKGVRPEIDRLIARHVESDPPPQGLLSPSNKKAHQIRWAPYDQGFSEVIAAPFAVADHATGEAALSPHEVRRCRDAWLYDQEFFEAMVPIGIDERLRGAASKEMKRS